MNILANWRDFLSIAILASIFSMWVWVPLTDDVRGASIMLATIVVQFYFRKAGSEQR